MSGIGISHVILLKTLHYLLSHILQNEITCYFWMYSCMQTHNLQYESIGSVFTSSYTVVS